MRPRAHHLERSTRLDSRPHGQATEGSSPQTQAIRGEGHRLKTHFGIQHPQSESQTIDGQSPQVQALRVKGSLFKHLVWGEGGGGGTDSLATDFGTIQPLILGL